MSVAKKVGRPRGQSIYMPGGVLHKVIVNLIRDCGGITACRDRLILEGVQVQPGKPKERLPVSMPTLVKIAKLAKIKLRRGRPERSA